jgi:WS/DGAT/MGAT family acyltransferase
MTIAATERLNALDATFLELEEADDSAHMHIGAVVLLESTPEGGAPAIDRVRAEIASRLQRLPRYRQRLSEPQTGGLRWQAWEEDPHFDIARHVRAEGLPQPADADELRRWAGEYFSVRLDRRRPLWEMVVLELADGRWAMVTKTHHCLVDGVGSVDAGKVLLDPVRDPFPASNGQGEKPAEKRAGDAAEEMPALLRMAGASLRLAGRAVDGAARGIASAGSAIGTATDPHRIAETLGEARAAAALVVRDEVNAAPATSLNGPIGTHRRLAVTAVELDTLKRIRGVLGGTVNDAILAVATAGFRELLLARGEEPPEQGLRAMVPVNIRPAADRLSLGNRITSLFVHLPVAIEGTLDRYRAQVEEAEGLKSSNQGAGSRGIIDFAALAPPALHSFLARSLFATRLFNVTITNVPGPQQPLYAFGCEVEEIWPLVPLAASHAIGLAIMSYNGTAYMCLNADHDSVPDLARVQAGLEQEIRELDAIATAAAVSN